MGEPWVTRWVTECKVRQNLPITTTYSIFFSEFSAFMPGKYRPGFLFIDCGSDRQSMRAKGLVMGLYDNLDDKLFCTLAGSYTYTLGNRVWATFTYLYVHGVANPRIEDG